MPSKQSKQSKRNTSYDEVDLEQDGQHQIGDDSEDEARSQREDIGDGVEDGESGSERSEDVNWSKLSQAAKNAEVSLR